MLSTRPYTAITTPASSFKPCALPVSATAYGSHPTKPFALRSTYFVNELTDDLSTALVKKVQNRYGVEIRPWDRAGFTRSNSPQTGGRRKQSIEPVQS
jgi:hypothetical protein